jgi:hypothetical protein
VADIFFSYSRRDRERVGLVRNALAEMGFEVFWDQETPSGSDWDTWIRGELAKSKCAVVFWSATSTVSDNVRHEAVVAKEQRKLISVFLDQLPARDLPMGFYSQQAADLSKWNGDQEDTEWRKFRSEFEAKLMPRWVQQKLNSVDAELEGERARRESAEAHEKTLRTQISKEAKIQQDLKRERDGALAEVEEVRAAGEERDKALQSQFAKQADIEQGLKTERDRAVAEVGKLKTTIEGLTRARSDAEAHPTSQPMKSWLSPVAFGALLLAAVLGGTLVSVWRTPNSGGERGADQAKAALAASDAARQTAEAQATNADKARQTAEAKTAEISAALAKSEQARQAAEARAVDAEKARQAAATKADDADKAKQVAVAKADDAERNRRAAEAKAADADKARQAAEGKADLATAALSKSEQARQAAETKAADLEKARQAAAAKVAGTFTRRTNMEAKSKTLEPSIVVGSTDACERRCAQNNACNIFTYLKQNGLCYLFSSADLVANDLFDSGMRN